MTLQEKLDSINQPSIPTFKKSHSQKIKDYWTDFIEPHLPQNIEIVIKWHNLLKKYVKTPNVVLGFRTGNSAGHLRRGWETVTDAGYSFFYTDNYFPHFFFKMAYDGYVPKFEEFESLMKSKKFPVRYKDRMGTKDEPWEKEYAAFNVDGVNPGIGISGYKLAHILDAGRNYNYKGKKWGISEICKNYFRLGKVSEWKKDVITGLYCRKNFKIPPKNRKTARIFAEACFLRMVHPMNYFVSPKSKRNGNIYNIYKKGNNIAEDPDVLSYVRMKLHERYKKNGVDYFQEFLDMVLPFDDLRKEDGNTVLDITYSPRNLSSHAKILPHPKTEKKKVGDESSLPSDLVLIMAKEYLCNPNTAFRTLEKNFMHIDSPQRGGGFKAKKIINNLGITAEKKGVLYETTIDSEIKKATGIYKETLVRVKKTLFAKKK